MIADLGIAKAIVGEPELLFSGNYVVTYQIVIESDCCEGETVSDQFASIEATTTLTSDAATDGEILIETDCEVGPMTPCEESAPCSNSRTLRPTFLKRFGNWPSR